MNIFKFRYASIFALSLMLMLSCVEVYAVDFVIKGGIDNPNVKVKMERSLSTLLTEINAAHDSGRKINYGMLGLAADVESSMSALWDNSPFFCYDDVVAQYCIKRNNGQYEVRNIPLELRSKDGKSDEVDYQEAVVKFDAKGNIVDFNLSISTQLCMKVLKDGKDVKDKYYRELILDFTERFRTAYNTHDKEFLEAVFSDDALIITGHVVTKQHTVDGMPLSTEKVVMKKQTKKEYLDKLEKIFAKDHNYLIRVTFDDIEIMRHPSPKHNKMFGVTLHQGYTSATYHDDGYLFLVWDFTDEQKPKIHVRTWQPDAYSKDGLTKTRISKDEIFCLDDFDFDAGPKEVQK